MSDVQNRNVVVLLKEVRLKQEEFKNSLSQLTQSVNEHQVIDKCLKDFAEEEWAKLVDKITRNNLFQMEKNKEILEEEKEVLA